MKSWLRQAGIAAFYAVVKKLLAEWQQALTSIWSSQLSLEIVAKVALFG